MIWSVGAGMLVVVVGNGWLDRCFIIKKAGENSLGTLSDLYNTTGRGVN